MSSKNISSPIPIDDLLSDTITIDSSTGFSQTTTFDNSLNWSIGSMTGNSVYYTNTTNPYPYMTTTDSLTPSNTLEMNGENADLKINGKSLKEFMEKVEERLLILQPNPAKLEKYEALRKAYEHYKLLEKLVQED